MVITIIHRIYILCHTLCQVTYLIEFQLDNSFSKMYWGTVIEWLQVT